MANKGGPKGVEVIRPQMNDDVFEIRGLSLSKLFIDDNLEYGQVRGIHQSRKLLLARPLQLKAPT